MKRRYYDYPFKGWHQINGMIWAFVIFALTSFFITALGLSLLREHVTLMLH